MKSQSNPQFAFTTRFNGLSNILITEIEILPPTDFPTIQFQPTKIKAIWDTGATHTCITEKLAKQLNLVPTGKRETKTANGSKIADVYLVDIGLPNRVAIQSMQVTGVEIQDGIDALVGMDIIGKGDFSVTNADGKTVFSYRIPSVSEVDYVKTINNKKVKAVSSESKKKEKNKKKQANATRSKNRKKSKKKK